MIISPQSTSVLIVSYGTNMGLNWRRGTYFKTDGWKEDRSRKKKKMNITNESCMLLHLLDEIPRRFKYKSRIYCYKHGTVKVMDN